MARITAAALAALLAATPVFAWSTETHLALAEQGARFAPTDMRTQLERHQAALREGVLAAQREDAAGRPPADALREATERAIAAIEGHEPFADVIHRLGAAVYWAALVNDPLRRNDGAQEAAYGEDYRSYMESARPRFTVAFYGEGRDVATARSLEALARAARRRGAAYAPLLAQEYERIGYGRGVELFDDRSTAFGIAALSYSHAVSDVIASLRYIWIAAGGADRRQLPHLTPPE